MWVYFSKEDCTQEVQEALEEARYCAQGILNWIGIVFQILEY